jgi:hypothetical protein
MTTTVKNATADFRIPLPAVVTEYLPAMLVGQFDDATAAFVAGGCTVEQATVAASELSRRLALSADGSHAAMLPDTTGLALGRLCSVSLLPSKKFGAFHASESSAFEEDRACMHFCDLAAAVTGSSWRVLTRQRVVGFGPSGWER